MKILLIRPKNTKAFSLFAKAGGLTIPLGISYIAALLMKKGYQVKVLDNLLENLEFQEIEEYIRDYNPDIVGISATTVDIYQGFQIAKITKKINKNMLLVIGGHHVTTLPEETVKNENVDVVVVGEGEQTALELVEAVKNKKSFKEIKGLYYKENDQIVFTGQRELIENLDILPFPARELLEMGEYTLSATRKRVQGKAGAVITSRGCPFNCNFCCKKVFGRTMRYRSAENIVAEIELIMDKYDIKEISFIDDAFTINRKHVINVCNLLIEKKLNLSWVCHSRVDCLDDELLKIMKKAGCHSIAFGIESGDQKVLDSIGKQTTLEKAREVITLTKKYKISSLCGFMIGNLGETKETVMKTIKFARELDCTFANFAILVPLPGSKVFDIAKEKGLIDDKNYDRYTALSNQKPVLPLSELTSDELVFYQKLGYRKFYFRPKYIFKKILKLKNPEDFKQGFRGLQAILKHQLHKYTK
ncbi:B12-binding domain-containing radical SAM protein [Patescibacteria group bacterium]|nr:B12-binding domain-containing radical SAM protein [Patescibacteria group bacterium]